MEPGVAERDAAAAEERLLGADDAAFQRRQRHHHLEGRARRVLARYGLVGQRRIGMVQDGAPLLSAEPHVEGVGIEARLGDEGKDGSGMDVEHHRGTALFLAHAVDGEILQTAVDGQRQVVARLAFAARQRAHHPAHRVDLHLAVARLAA